MEKLRNNAEVYSLEWFKNRALSSFKSLGNGVWDYSDSLLLYVPGTEGEYESMQETETPYYRLVTQPEESYLKDIAAQVTQELPNRFAYVDLGPGTAHKEQYIFDAAKQQHKEFVYIPVDISKRFLALSEKYASDQGFPVEPTQASFEEVAHTLKKMGAPRFVSLGLTYTNYDPGVILPLLTSIAGEGGSVFINAQMRDRVDMAEVERIYREDVIGIAKSKLELLGLNIETDVSAIETDDGIRAWCTLNKSTPALKKRGVLPGSRLLIFQSIRYTKDAFERDVALHSSSYKILDTGGPFVGALLKA